jgi:hypothetical protein
MGNLNYEDSAYSFQPLAKAETAKDSFAIIAMIIN